MGARRPTMLHNFFEQDAPPQVVFLRSSQGGLETRDLMQQWPVRKTLTSRDINYSQVVLPREQVEESLLPQFTEENQDRLNRGQQVPIVVRDLETRTEHNLKIWENGSSYVLTGGWSAGFVRRRQLQIGEEVAFCWDLRLDVLRFSVISRPPVTPPAPPAPAPGVEALAFPVINADALGGGANPDLPVPPAAAAEAPEE